jgi:hypothetical protein
MFEKLPLWEGEEVRGFFSEKTSYSGTLFLWVA